eukprot:GHVU01103226.1.p1 GENE.GHVU01103226.1~~GHVU01103226.1.p1  ORF type:complete len:130 (-),score=7.15 GHVU01103226.1:122-511(-)
MCSGAVRHARRLMLRSELDSYEIFVRIPFRGANSDVVVTALLWWSYRVSVIILPAKYRMSDFSASPRPGDFHHLVFLSLFHFEAVDEVRRGSAQAGGVAQTRGDGVAPAAPRASHEHVQRKQMPPLLQR